MNQPLPLRDVAVTITVIADTDARAREVIEVMTEEEGSVFDVEITEIVEYVPPPTPTQTD